MILSLETSTLNCSVALHHLSELVALSEKHTGTYVHSEQLHLLIAEVIEESGIQIKDIDAVAVSMGPGSYTGLRIGVSAAKGLCYALDKPLIAVTTLAVLARQIEDDTSYIYAVLDARRDEVYSALYDAQYGLVRAVQSEIIQKNTNRQFLNYQPLTIIGVGTKKCNDIMKLDSNIKIIEAFPSARELGLWACEKYVKKDFEDVAYFEPYYLKDFRPG